MAATYPDFFPGAVVRLTDGPNAGKVGKVVFASNHRRRPDLPLDPERYIVRLSPGFLTTLLRREQIEPAHED